MSASDKFIESIKDELREEMKTEFETIARETFKESLDNITLDVKQTAKYLSVCEQTVQNMVAQKEIPHMRPRKRVIFRKASLDEWMNEQEKRNYKAI